MGGLVCKHKETAITTAEDLQDVYYYNTADNQKLAGNKKK